MPCSSTGPGVFDIVVWEIDAAATGLCPNPVLWLPIAVRLCRDDRSMLGLFGDVSV